MNTKPLILTVDHNQQNLELLGQCLRQQGYETFSVSTLENFELILEQALRFRMALIDISGFDRRIWRCCDQLTEMGVPLFVVSPPRIASVRQESFTHGAQGVLVKPLAVKEFTNLVHNIVRQTSNE